MPCAPNSVVMGVIVGYRRSRRRQYNDRVLIKVLAEAKLAGSLVGRRVEARDARGNVYRGRVIRIHSLKNGVVEAAFRPNIPGQLIGSLVSIMQGSSVQL